MPVPTDSNAVVEAIFEGLLLREDAGSVEGYLPGFEEYLRTERARLHTDWDNATDREKRSRTMYAQEGLQANVSEVAKELDAAQTAIGSGADVESFTKEVLKAYGAAITSKNKHTDIDLSGVPAVIREICNNQKQIRARFELPVGSNVKYLSRTHPIVEGLGDYVLNSALDGSVEAIAKRCGAIRTDAIQARTTLLLLRYRYHIIAKHIEGETQLLAEDSQLVCFQGAPQNAIWLDAAQAESLLLARPTQNIAPEQASNFVKTVIDGYEHIKAKLDQFAVDKGKQLLDAHRRVRSAARLKNIKYDVRPELPPDVLGIYVYLPAGND